MRCRNGQSDNCGNSDICGTHEAILVRSCSDIQAGFLDPPGSREPVLVKENSTAMLKVDDSIWLDERHGR